MAEHAILSPSSAERWLVCPGSVALCATLPYVDDSSSYAAEGTVAHELGFLKASLRFGKISQGEYDRLRAEWFDQDAAVIGAPGVEAEMDLHTDAYVAHLAQVLEETPFGEVLLEQRLETGVPESWGTSDAVIISPSVVRVVDLKYGKGIQVQAAGNPQLRLYACGALSEYGDLLGVTETVSATVFQPRIDHVDTETLRAEELRAWREEIVPIAESALAGSDVFAPSEDACRWCPASGRCPAQMADVFEVDFTPKPAGLGPADLATALEKAPQIRTWLTALEKAALEVAYTQEIPIPGFKVVLSGGQRGVRDQAAAIEVLRAAGYADEQILNTKVKGIGDLEGLLGDQFAPLLEAPGIVTKSEGKPALVPESDNRPHVSPNLAAAEAFKEIV